MTEEVRVLPYFGTPTAVQVQAIKAAKQAINPGFLILPKRVDDDTVGAALAFEWPSYAYLYGFAYVKTVDTSERMRMALEAIWYGVGSDRLTTPAKWLSRAHTAFEGTREVEDE